jgi:hypothetical protein
VWNLRSLRQHLAAIGLDWERPPYPAQSEKQAVPVQLRVLEGSPERLQRMHAAVVPRLPPGDPQANPWLIDRGEHYNMALTDSWLTSDPARENSLAELPRGAVRLAGVEFDVRGIVQLAGRVPASRNYPRRITGIRVGRTRARLHFLHATARLETEGTRVGSYVVHFANGRRRECPIVYGQNVRDYWVKSGEPEISPSLVEAWTGHNAEATAYRASIRLFKASWKNPWPEVPIESIDFESELTQCEPFLIAITAEP